MEINDKLKILADAAKYDASCASSGSYRKRSEGGLGNTEGMGICHSYTPDGRCVSLLKVLLTNYCIYDCSYCVNRISSDTPRARFSPEEVVFLTIEFYKRNYIEGLFLSSGIIQNPDYTMEQLISVARILRSEHNFGGYIHLKAVPSAASELYLEAGKWADRLSANIELPLDSELQALAPAKSHPEIENAMLVIQRGILEANDKTTGRAKSPVFAPAGQSTQMIVGATPAADEDVLSKASQLYRNHRLRRVYYSAFSPIPHADPTLPLQRPPMVREHRLYQADWLMRFYGFEAHELTTPEAPNLALDKDPKLAWALRHRDFFPVDVNKASRSALLRIPGIGVRNVKRILGIRRFHALKLEDLAKLKISVRKSAFFIIAADHNPSSLQIDTVKLPEQFAQQPRQLALFEARTGEL
ncbi:MAG TPA: putative DNA modification/repair radical SAM protein [Bryobacteraceae bacterium]|nr:putative DNA modification/repair radical SAM protein [Bryobacteraceae bacterium]